MPITIALLALLCASALALDHAIDAQSETASALLEPRVQGAAQELIGAVVSGEPTPDEIKAATEVTAFYALHGCAWAVDFASGGDVSVANRVRELFPKPATV